MLKDNLKKLFEAFPMINNEELVQHALDALMAKRDWKTVAQIIKREVRGEDNVDSETNLELQDEIAEVLYKWQPNELIALIKRVSGR